MSDPETPTDPPAASTGTDAGVAEPPVVYPERYVQKLRDELAQQATQLQEARQALDATEEEMELFKAHAFRLADELEASKSQLTSLRAELEVARKTLAKAAIPLEALRLSECDAAATAFTGSLKASIVSATDAIRATFVSSFATLQELETAQQARDFQQRRADERMGAFERQGAMHADALDALAEANRKLSEAAFTSLGLLHRANTAEADFSAEKLETERLHAALEAAETALAEARRALDEALLDHQDARELLAAWKQLAREQGKPGRRRDGSE